MPEQKKVAPAVAACVAAAVIICAPFTSRFEGEKLHPYRDPAGVKTVCDGETEMAMRDYTHDECQVMLRVRQSRDYAPKVLACVPELAHHRMPFAASIDSAYNAGTVAFCRSPMALAFNQGRWADGCKAFRTWFIRARVHGKPTALKGLVRRRQAESTLCLRED